VESVDVMQTLSGYLNFYGTIKFLYAS